MECVWTAGKWDKMWLNTRKWDGFKLPIKLHWKEKKTRLTLSNFNRTPKFPNTLIRLAWNDLKCMSEELYQSAAYDSSQKLWQERVMLQNLNLFWHFKYGLDQSHIFASWIDCLPCNGKKVQTMTGWFNFKRSIDFLKRDSKSKYWQWLFREKKNSFECK